MSTESRGFKILLIILFLGMIWLPLVMISLQFGRQPENSFIRFEMRSPSEYPPVPRTIADFSTYPATFEKAFSDQFPLREQSIQLYSKLCLEWLGTPTNSQLLVGKNGHCYLGSHFDDRSYLAALTAVQTNEAALPYEVAQIEAYAEFLETLPIPSVMLSIPTSHVLDYENLPDFIQRQANPDALKTPQYLRVMQSVKHSVRERFLLCPLERIRQQNAEYPLYAEKNFHWHTGRYTWLTASSIAEHFGVARYEEPRPEEFRYKSMLSDLFQFASYEIYSNNAEVYQPDALSKVGVEEKPFSEVYPNLPSLPETRYMMNPNQKHSILVVGESFTPMLAPDLARYFGEVIAVNYNIARHAPASRTWLTTVMNDIRPDFAVFLHHERFYLFEDFIADYEAIERSKPLQVASDPETAGSRN